jgi:hypothetical protein
LACKGNKAPDITPHTQHRVVALHIPCTHMPKKKTALGYIFNEETTPALGMILHFQ